MQKNNIIGGAIVLMAILGIVFYAATQPDKREVTKPSTTLPDTGYSEHAKYYDITANYATSTPLLQTVGKQYDTSAKELMHAFVSNTITAFKSEGNFENLTAEDVKMMGFDQGRKEKLNIVYMTAVSNRSISYIFTIYTDTFGAHGNLDFGTFTFDVKTGDRLKLGDIFMPGTNYLETLSLLSQSKLPAVIGQRADTSTINKGTAPEENNFERFFLDTKELVLLFPPYQVAAYSEGPQTLRIPLTELSSILKPEYR
ncbi:MAG: RsiV family protein [bacterium]|nr:RsiV family protein [bacterium]MDO8742215.1 RsiV family protein [bacterium]